MPLVKSVLKTAIRAAQKTASQAASVDAAEEQFAELLATAIDAYIKTGTVNTQVNTTGGPAAQTGVGIGTIT